MYAARIRSRLAQIYRISLRLAGYTAAAPFYGLGFIFGLVEKGRKLAAAALQAGYSDGSRIE